VLQSYLQSEASNFKTPTHCQNPSSLSPIDDETHMFYLSLFIIFLPSKIHDVVEQLLGLLMVFVNGVWLTEHANELGYQSEYVFVDIINI
jgi:hypothetical protein